MVSEYFCDGVAANTSKCGKERLAQLGPVVPPLDRSAAARKAGSEVAVARGPAWGRCSSKTREPRKKLGHSAQAAHHRDRVDRWGGVHGSRGAVSREVRGHMANSKIIHVEACYNEDSQAGLQRSSRSGVGPGI